MFDADDLLDPHPRRKFEQTLEERCATGDEFALMLVDLDQFERIIADHGTNVSDLLLFEATARMRDALSPGDLVMRSGDSQFAVLVDDTGETEAIQRLARTLIERLEIPMKVSGTRFRLTANIGITLFPQHGKDWKALLLSADTAAYDARTQGRGTISVSFPAVGGEEPPTR